MFRELIATGLLVGRLPAPGTLGTLLGIPVVYLVAFSPLTLLVALGLLFFLGLYSSKEMIKRTGDRDPEEVVIDEITGYVACFLFVEPVLKTYLLAFLIFRLLDIFKPFPIDLFEKLPGPYGVMVDDLIAGVLTSLVLFLLLK